MVVALDVAKAVLGAGVGESGGSRVRRSCGTFSGRKRSCSADRSSLADGGRCEGARHAPRIAEMLQYWLQVIERVREHGR
jgi:hypothetical protein